MPSSPALSLSKLLTIAIFAVVGVIARYLVGLAFTHTLSSSEFPLSTFVINMVGSLAIGVVYVLFTEKGLLAPELQIGILVGLLGGKRLTIKKTVDSCA